MSEKNIAIIGAGIGGIATALALKKQLGFSDFTIYEKANDVGGTWRENTYPGAACDIHSHWYSFSDEQNPNWSKVFSSQPEIQAYLRSVVVKRDILPHIRFGAKLVHAVWDSDAQEYKLELEYTDTAEDGSKATRTQLTTANILISAIGLLHEPALPNIKGINTFKGDMFHPARWRHDVSLQGKRVGIIGNGCSAAQIVPEISGDESVSVVNFCRTPSWFLPREQFTVPESVKWVFQRIPFALTLTRMAIYLYSDLLYAAWEKENTRTRKTVRSVLEWYIRKKAPSHLHEELTPKYDPGCKRLIRDPGYLQALHRPNVALEWDPIVEVVEDGIITKSGTKHPLDIIVPATGFAMDHIAAPVKGKTRTVAEYFKANSGPTAYRGTTLPGFPNFFTIFGPNVASGHASVVFEEEVQINYLIKMIKPILEGRIQSFDVTENATDAYNVDLQKKLQGTIWDGCFSWYNQQGGKNVAVYPGFATKWWWVMRNPIWGDYKVEKADKIE